VVCYDHVRVVTGIEMMIAKKKKKKKNKDFRYIPYPRSLGRPEQTKEEFLEYWAGNTSLWATRPEVSYIGCSSDLFAVTKFLPQETFRFIVDTPGKLVVHVRI
jgi:hypothetical protein